MNYIHIKRDSNNWTFAFKYYLKGNIKLALSRSGIDQVSTNEVILKAKEF